MIDGNIQAPCYLTFYVDTIQNITLSNLLVDFTDHIRGYMLKLSAYNVSSFSLEVTKCFKRF